MRLNHLLNYHKRKMEEKNPKKKKGESFDDPLGKNNWATSNMVLMFLENSIKKLTKNPVYGGEDAEVPSEWKNALEKFKPTLMTYTVFKNLVWEIYIHRITNAPEINGHMNTSYLTLDEHLLIFMIL